MSASRRDFIKGLVGAAAAPLVPASVPAAAGNPLFLGGPPEIEVAGVPMRYVMVALPGGKMKIFEMRVTGTTAVIVRGPTGEVRDV